MRRVTLLVGAVVVVVALALVQLGDSATDQGLLVFGSVRIPQADARFADSFSNLFLLRPDGTGLRRLTRVREVQTGATWSPDGRRIAFSRGVQTGCHGGSCGNDMVAEIWVIDAAGTNAKRLTHELAEGWDATRDYSPTWSPDGKQIAFVHRKTFADLSPTDGISVVGVDGRGVHRVVAGPAGSPTWSPDGKMLAFVLRGEAESGKLGLLDLQTGESRYTPSYRRSAWSPSWSPDGRTLAYVANSKVALLDVQTGQVTYGSPAMAVSWSPNGRWLAITRSNGVFVVAVHGGLPRRIVALTTAPERKKDLSYLDGVSWSPDSRHLAFSATQHDRVNLCLERLVPRGASDVFIVGIDGSGLKRITGNRCADYAPDWRP